MKVFPSVRYCVCVCPVQVSRLQIVSVMEEHAGVYQCVASLVVAGGDQRQAAANERLSVIRKFTFSLIKSFLSRFPSPF